MSRGRFFSDDDPDMSVLMSTASKPGRLSSRPPSPRCTSPIGRESNVAHDLSWLRPEETRKWDLDLTGSSCVDLPSRITVEHSFLRDESMEVLPGSLLLPTEGELEKTETCIVSPFDFLGTSQLEDDEVEDPFGQIGNFDMKLPGSNDSRFEIEGESFNFGGDDNRRLMDAEEKKFALSDDISISFSNLTTSENAHDVVNSLSQSLYFMTNSSRLGSLGNDEFGRPPSEEFRPDFGFAKISDSPKKSKRQTYLIETVQADAEGDHRQSSSSNLPDFTQPASALRESSKVKKMLETSSTPAVSQDERDEDVFLPSFLEATTAFEKANETMQVFKKPLSSMPPPSRIPKVLPKSRKAPTAVPPAARHSSPMKKVVKPDQLMGPPIVKIDRPFGNTNTRATEQVQVKATSANQSPAINEFPIIADKSILLWTGVSAGDNEQTVVHLKNSTNSPLRAMLKIRDSDKFLFADTKSSLSEVTVEGGSIKDVAVTFCPTKAGWYVGKINIKLPSASKGPGIKAVLRLKGHCGQPDFVLEYNKKQVNGALLELGEMTTESVSKVTVRNVGNASGFLQLVVPEDCLIPSPSNFVLGPTQEQVVTFKLHPDMNLIGPLTGSITMICGTEVCRQTFKLLGASSAKSPLGVELNGDFPNQEVASEDLKALQGIKFIGTDIIPFYKTTKKVVMDFSAIAIWSSGGVNFCPLPIEETLNESQMSVTITTTQRAVNRPETIAEENEESPREHSISRDKVKLKPVSVFFPPTTLGEASSFKVTIENRNPVRLFLQAEPLSLPFTNHTKPFEVKPKFFTSYPIQYMPTEAGTHKETLTLRILNGTQFGIDHGSFQVPIKGSFVRTMLPSK